jgi:sulfide dehydrogenase cytochrome subunit
VHDAGCLPGACAEGFVYILPLTNLYIPDFSELIMVKQSTPLLKLACALLLSASGVSGVYAQQSAEALHQRATAAMCSNCHGTDGRTVEGSAIPSLVGMPKDYMVLQMKAFKEGSRPATVMHQISKGLTDAQVNTIANYYANTKR